ncbi:S41 family peptidase [Flavitalea sp.]|nr:S41 family peptidase [Flavitalea sp.]
MKRIFAFIILITLMSSVSSRAQNLSKKEMDAAISSIAKLIENNYVFEAKGKTIATYILQEYRNGRFDRIANWKAFDSVTTQCLQRFSHDGHLYVRNDPQTVKDLLLAQKDTPDSNEAAAFSYDPFYYGAAAIKKNFGFSEVRVLEDNTGYIKLSEINISAKSLPVLYATMEFVSNTRALIIDLRNNGGGGSEVGEVLQSFFLPGNTPLLEFKTRNGQSRLEQTVLWLTEKRYDHPLFIIVNKGTASAAEAFAYSLQNCKRATIIGQPSAGAANMNSWYVVNDHIYVSVSTAAPTIPGTERSWEQKGVQPDHVVQSGDEIEYILKRFK